MGHLLGVASIVIDAGGTENEAIAAILHDSVEDSGGYSVLDFIKRNFGVEVADIVAACSDTFVTPKPEWRTRKENHITRLRLEDASVHLVYVADKIHNLRSLRTTVKKDGLRAFESFKGGVDGTLWYFRSVIAALIHAPNDLRLEASAILREIEIDVAILSTTKD